MPHAVTLIPEKTGIPTGLYIHEDPVSRSGHPISHGCIRTTPRAAKFIKEHIVSGVTEITVVKDLPEYERSLEAQTKKFVFPKKPKQQKSKKPTPLDEDGD